MKVDHISCKIKHPPTLVGVGGGGLESLDVPIQYPYLRKIRMRPVSIFSICIQ